MRLGNSLQLVTSSAGVAGESEVLVGRQSMGITD